MFYIKFKYLVPKGYRGITLFPFVFMQYESDRKNPTFINHERIHLRQQLELLIIPFFVWYFLEFLLRYVQYKNWDLAYRNISFEREAYANEKKSTYLEKRSWWRFVNYLKK